MRSNVLNIVGLGFLAGLGCQNGSAGDGDFGGTAESGSATADGSTTQGTSTGGATDDDDSASPPKLDVAPPETTGVEDTDGPCGCGSDQSTYLWAANTADGTVSQIDTLTLEEVGRFRTAPGGSGDPSRTSVSVDGRAVVVSNRADGSVTKIWAHKSDCDELNNGTAGLQSSTGKGEVLTFGEDDCVQWHTTFTDAWVGRPVAWTSGTPNAACEYVDQKVWTTVCRGNDPLDPSDDEDSGDSGESGGEDGFPPDPWANDDGVTVFLLDGETGAIEAEVDVPTVPCMNTSAYGGAVDNEGNFYFHSQQGVLGRIELATLEVEVFEITTGYGITVDTEGRVWFTQPLSRFDPETGQQDFVYGAQQDPSTISGLAQDDQGRIWFATTNSTQTQHGLAAVEIETLDVVAEADLPGNTYEEVIKGVSVDVNGYVWAVDWLNAAHRYNPSNGALDSYEGLNSPYTYSDMTGGQIQNVTCNPPAEG